MMNKHADSATTFDPKQYGAAIAAILDGDSQRNRAQRIEQLDNASEAELFGASRVVDRQMAGACRAGLWLWLDELDRSHTISQELPTPTGSFWHGIMHRREPDYSNAKYWFHRVGEHPIYAPLAAAARTVAQAAGELPPEARYLADQTVWDPCRFTDWCQQVDRGRASGEGLYRELERLEWSILFDHCYHATIGN